MQCYRARIVLPLCAPPIEDGAVWVDGNRIAAVGRYDTQTGIDADAVVDLGDGILMPGLINAHCHLDYTGMCGRIPSGASFADWIRSIVAEKATHTDEAYLEAIRDGLLELQQSGCTSVFNMEAYPKLLEKMHSPPIRTWWFYELLDARTRVHVEEVIQRAEGFFDERRQWMGGFGICPHAPYSTSLELYQESTQCAEKYAIPFTTHLSESEEEFQMFCEGKGALHAMAVEMGHRGVSRFGRGSPLTYLRQHHALPRGAILVHMNHLTAEDVAWLEEHAQEVSIVHCPKCHAYFGRGEFPFRLYRALGVSVSLGTDSCASNDGLNLFAEMQCFAREFPEVPSEEVLQMVTRNPARAIGEEMRLGCIRRGAYSDLIFLPSDVPCIEVYDAVVHYARQIPWMLVGGRVVYALSVPRECA